MHQQTLSLHPLRIEDVASTQRVFLEAQVWALILCWSSRRARRTTEREATGVLTTTRSDRSIRGLNNPLPTPLQPVPSVIGSPHATHACRGLLGHYLSSHRLVFHKLSESQLFIQNRRTGDVDIGCNSVWHRRQHSLLKSEANASFSLITSRGRLLWLQKEVCFYRSLWENDSTSHLIYSLSNIVNTSLWSQSLVSSLLQYSTMLIW